MNEQLTVNSIRQELASKYQLDINLIEVLASPDYDDQTNDVYRLQIRLSVQNSGICVHVKDYGITCYCFHSLEGEDTKAAINLLMIANRILSDKFFDNTILTIPSIEGGG